MTDTLWIVSTRDPDGDPVCELTWAGHRWYAAVAAVRQTALDLVTCAAYAEMMRELITTAKLPPATMEAFTTSLLRTTGRRGPACGRGVPFHPAGQRRAGPAVRVFEEPA